VALGRRRIIYIPYDDPQAILLPDSKRAVSLQILCLRNLLQNVSTIVEADILPTFSSCKCFSMSRIGLKTPMAAWLTLPAHHSGAVCDNGFGVA
jgi:hypothetical protein